MNRGARLERLPLLVDRRPLAYGLALAMSAVAWWLRTILDPVFPPGFPFLTFFPAVILSSFLFGRGPGIAAAITCGLLAWYFFTPPFHSFTLVWGTALALTFYVGVVAVDITLIHWMQRANERVRVERERSRDLAEERGRLAEHAELLFHELQHRVSNNLQMAGAVLSLQRRGVGDPTARRALDEAAAKLQLIGRIQRQLYGLRGEQMPLDHLLPELTRDLVTATGRPGVTWAIQTEPGIMLPPNAAIPVALIMAEAVANAIEHGFAERDQGHIQIEVTHHAERIELIVRDDGAGLPEGFDAATSQSLGLKVARTLAANLAARMEIEPACPGTRMRLSLPIGARDAC